MSNTITQNIQLTNIVQQEQGIPENFFSLAIEKQIEIALYQGDPKLLQVILGENFINLNDIFIAILAKRIYFFNLEYNQNKFFKFLIDEYDILFNLPETENPFKKIEQIKQDLLSNVDNQMSVKKRESMIIQILQNINKFEEQIDKANSNAKKKLGYYLNAQNEISYDKKRQEHLAIQYNQTNRGKISQVIKYFTNKIISGTYNAENTDLNNVPFTLEDIDAVMLDIWKNFNKTYEISEEYEFPSFANIFDNDLHAIKNDDLQKPSDKIVNQSLDVISLEKTNNLSSLNELIKPKESNIYSLVFSIYNSLFKKFNIVSLEESNGGIKNYFIRKDISDPQQYKLTDYINILNSYIENIKNNFVKMAELKTQYDQNQGILANRQKQIAIDSLNLKKVFDLIKISYKKENIEQNIFNKKLIESFTINYLVNILKSDASDSLTNQLKCAICDMLLGCVSDSKIFRNTNIVQNNINNVVLGNLSNQFFCNFFSDLNNPDVKNIYKKALEKLKSGKKITDFNNIVTIFNTENCINQLIKLYKNDKYKAKDMIAVIACNQMRLNDVLLKNSSTHNNSLASLLSVENFTNQSPFFMLNYISKVLFNNVKIIFNDSFFDGINVDENLLPGNLNFEQIFGFSYNALDINSLLSGANSSANQVLQNQMWQNQCLWLGSLSDVQKNAIIRLEKLRVDSYDRNRSGLYYKKDGWFSFLQFATEVSINNHPEIFNELYNIIKEYICLVLIFKDPLIFNNFLINFEEVLTIHIMKDCGSNSLDFKKIDLSNIKSILNSGFGEGYSIESIFKYLSSFIVNNKKQVYSNFDNYFSNNYEKLNDRYNIATKRMQANFERQGEEMRSIDQRRGVAELQAEQAHQQAQQAQQQAEQERQAKAQAQQQAEQERQAKAQAQQQAQQAQQQAQQERQAKELAEQRLDRMLERTNQDLFTQTKQDILNNKYSQDDLKNAKEEFSRKQYSELFKLILQRDTLKNNNVSLASVVQELNNQSTSSPSSNIAQSDIKPLDSQGYSYAKI